jgi:hypothetical protein
MGMTGQVLSLLLEKMELLGQMGSELILSLHQQTEEERHQVLIS